MIHRPRQRPGRASLTSGLILVALGSWFLLEQLGIRLPPLYELWPALLLLTGVSALVSFAAGRRHHPGVVWRGTTGVLSGIFFFAFTLGPLDWEQMEQFWPILPMIAGLAFLATWVAGGGKDVGLLAPAALGVGVGVVGLSWTLEVFQDWVLPAVEFGWPLILIAVGLALIVRAFRRPSTEISSTET